MSSLAALSRFAQHMHARYSVLRPLIEGTRAAVFLADSFLAFVLFLAWLGTFGVVFKVSMILRGVQVSRSREILFLSQEGFTVAPTRIRSYFFAEKLASLGNATRVLAFWDDIYKFEHLPDRPVFGVERVVVALRAVHRLIADPPAVIIEQRPTYDLLTTSIVRWLRGTTVIFDIDDWIGDYTWFYPLRVEAVLPRFRSIASACIVSSTRLERELAPIFPVTVKIPTYVDTNVFRPREVERSSPEVVFGWNGTLFQEFMFESLSVMLKAFSLACDRLGGSTAIAMEIAGTGDYFPKLEELLAKDYSEYPIRIKGWLDPRTMSGYLDTIDVGLYSLVVTDARRGTAEETFIVSKSPTKVFEYMAKGIPTISTRVGEVGNVIEQDVTGICSDDVGQLCEGFVRLAGDADLRRKMGMAAREQCERQFSMDAAALQLIEVVCGSGVTSTKHGGIVPKGAGINAAQGDKGACQLH